MRAGTLRERVTIQSFTVMQDEYGEPIETWANLATNPIVWANVASRAAGERFISGAEQVQSQISHTVRIRYRSDVTVQMRLVWGVSLLQIENVIDPNGRKSDLVLMCREVQINLSGSGNACEPFDQIDGSVSQSATFTHPANGVIAWTQTTLPSSAAVQVHFREQDVDNKWRIRIDSTGALLLDKYEGGVLTNNVEAATAAVANGHRVVIVCDDMALFGYSNGVLVWSHVDGDYAIEIDGRVNSLGVAGAIFDLKTWDLNCRAEEGV